MSTSMLRSMRTLLAGFALIVIFSNHGVEGLDCYACSGTNGVCGDPFLSGAAGVTTTTCPAPATGYTEACYKFVTTGQPGTNDTASRGCTEFRTYVNNVIIPIGCQITTGTNGFQASCLCTSSTCNAASSDHVSSILSLVSIIIGTVISLIVE